MGRLRDAFKAVTATFLLVSGAHAAPPTNTEAPQNLAPAGTIFSGDFSSGQDDVITDAAAANSKFVDEGATGSCRVVTTDPKGEVMYGGLTSERTANAWAKFANKELGPDGFKSVVKCTPPAIKTPGK